MATRIGRLARCLVLAPQWQSPCMAKGASAMLAWRPQGTAAVTLQPGTGLSTVTLQTQMGSHSWPMQRRGYRCCPGLDGAPPDVVVVEYDPEEVDRFIAMADAIEAAFPGVVVEGNPEGDGRAGSFEVKATSGELLFSRLATGAWPQEEQLVEALQAAAACEMPVGSSKVP